MEIEFCTLEDMFDFYEKSKDKDDEYFLDIYGQKITTHHHFLNQQKNALLRNDLYIEKKGSIKAIIKSGVVDKFHPNNINNQKFWKLAKQKFPLFSVNGGHSKNIDECNKGTLGMSKDFGIIKFIDEQIENSDTKLKIFEIGYGHAGFFHNYKDRVDYNGIDFYKIPELNEHKNLLVIKNSGIPRKFKNGEHDIIYSMNVLQHCSQKDRFQYFKDAYKSLKKGGYFIFSIFLVTDVNKDMNYWGVEDSHGRKYCSFFNQFTEVDTSDELYNIMGNIGFNLISSQNHANYFSFILQK